MDLKIVSTDSNLANVVYFAATITQSALKFKAVCKLKLNSDVDLKYLTKY
jgi:hypothetical protein